MAVFLILPNRSQEHSPVGTPIVSKIFGNTLLPRTTPFRRASWTTALECVTIRHRHLDAKLLLEGVAQYPYVGPPDVQFTYAGDSRPHYPQPHHGARRGRSDCISIKRRLHSLMILYSQWPPGRARRPMQTTSIFVCNVPLSPHAAKRPWPTIPKQFMVTHHTP